MTVKKIAMRRWLCIFFDFVCAPFISCSSTSATCHVSGEAKRRAFPTEKRVHSIEGTRTAKDKRGTALRKCAQGNALHRRDVVLSDAHEGQPKVGLASQTQRSCPPHKDSDRNTHVHQESWTASISRGLDTILML